MPTRSIKRLLLIAMLLVPVACTTTSLMPASQTAAAVAPPAAQKAFETAQKALAAGDLETARSGLLALTQAWPQFASPWINLGIVYERQGETEPALAAFHKAAAAKPGDCLAHVHAGVLLRKARKFDAAEKEYRQCLDHHPDYAPALIDLGILYEIYMGKWQDALAAYQHFQTLQPVPDKRVAGWIADLSRRIEQTSTIAAGGTNP